MRFTRSSLIRLIKILTAVILGGIIVAYAIWRSLNYARGPEIEIFEPANGSATASSTLVIRGQAKRINNLTLNGMPMFISEDGYFGNIVIIFPGVNRLTIAGRDQFGRETSESLEIVGLNDLVTPAPAPISSPATKLFENENFSIRYPIGYTPKIIENGISFEVSSSTVNGTNLSTDASLRVLSSPDGGECTPSLFLDHGSEPQRLAEGGTSYLVASSSDAAAGNRYDTTVYAIQNTQPCTAVMYFIHYGRIENYPEGTKKEFDQAALIRQFDEIRRSLKVK